MNNMRDMSLKGNVLLIQLFNSKGQPFGRPLLFIGISSIVLFFLFAIEFDGDPALQVL
jgi:hypothetical protein